MLITIELDADEETCSAVVFTIEAMLGLTTITHAVALQGA